MLLVNLLQAVKRTTTPLDQYLNISTFFFNPDFFASLKKGEPNAHATGLFFIRRPVLLITVTLQREIPPQSVVPLPLGFLTPQEFGYITQPIMLPRNTRQSPPGLIILLSIDSIISPHLLHLVPLTTEPSCPSSVWFMLRLEPLAAAPPFPPSAPGVLASFPATPTDSNLRTWSGVIETRKKG